MQAKAFTRLNRFPSQKHSFIKCEATNRYSAWIIHGNENTSTSCSIITKNAQDWQQHRMELCHSVNWTIIEWSEKVAEWHRYAIQSNSQTIQLTSSWLNGRDSSCECSKFQFWIHIIILNLDVEIVDTQVAQCIVCHLFSILKLSYFFQLLSENPCSSFFLVYFRFAPFLHFIPHYYVLLI